MTWKSEPSPPSARPFSGRIFYSKRFAINLNCFDECEEKQFHEVYSAALEYSSTKEVAAQEARGDQTTAINTREGDDCKIAQFHLMHFVAAFSLALAARNVSS